MKACERVGAWRNLALREARDIFAHLIGISLSARSLAAVVKEEEEILLFAAAATNSTPLFPPSPMYQVKPIPPPFALSHMLDNIMRDMQRLSRPRRTCLGYKYYHFPSTILIVACNMH